MVNQIVALIIAAGGGVFIRETIVGVWKWATGRQTRERSTLQKTLNDLDSEAAYRRILQEALSETRRIVIENGLGDKLPAYPQRPNKEDRKELEDE